MKKRMSAIRSTFTHAVICTLLITSPALRCVRASDHAEAPAIAHDAGADLADAYVFLDPANTNNVVMVMTLHGFIAPGENVNIGFFDPDVLYRFELEQTDDAKADNFIDIQFAPRTSPATGQVATVKLPNRHKFQGMSTTPTLDAVAPAPLLTTNDDGVVFFAGLSDDPFFFDVPAFNRFVRSVLAGTPDGTIFNRARDTFAGYNVLAIALSVPADLVRPAARGTNSNHVLGLAARTLRRSETPTAKGPIRSAGSYRSVDRAAIPAVNTALIPFAQKDRYNAASGINDARGEFVPGILATLNALGTSTNSQQLLAGLAVARGDYLRLNLNIPNSGTGRGVAGEPDAFPNGRRLQDDVIDVIISVVTNGGLPGDNVDANDVPFRTAFPFVAPPQQPRDTGVDDNTRN